MAPRRGTAAEPSRQSFQHTSSANNDELYDRGQNDRLLRKAINYLVKEGGSDPTVTYVERVQRIDEGILQRFRDRHYVYDPQLHQQLRSLVHEVRADFESVAGEESSVNLDDSDVSMDRVYSTDALYRDDDADIDSEIVSGPSGRRTAEVLKTEFLYGGPDNDVEEWHKDFPAALPFGETFYMQRWESMKIDYDLAESAKKNPDDHDPLVSTNVPYAAVEARFGKPAHHFESGSRFKIPAKVWKTWDQVIKTARDMLSLDKSVEEFNQGGDLKEQKDKDYAPRIFLPQVSPQTRRSQPSSTRAQAYNASEQHTPTPAPRRRSLSNNKSAIKRPQTAAFRNFDQRRRAVTKDTSAIAARPTARTLSFVQAGPSTSRAVQPAHKTAVESTYSTPKVTAISSKGRKRKTSSAAYIPSPTLESPVKKGKTTPSAKTPKKAASVKKSVAFVDRPRSSPPATKKASAAGKSSAKRKSNQAGSVPEVLSKDVQATSSSFRRGITRSGTKFK